ncbi:MAG: penicillin-binding transpeptidase domain-containing protein [Mycobacteriales bacterium]|nr:penicillin-binding transpeptidase domain-containing protein [Mycobacteriales bacterium]
MLDRKGRPLSASKDLTANVVGRPGSGLQRVLDDRLQGSSGSTVVVRDIASGTDIVTVKEFPPKAAEGVRTTLDLDVQRAAEAALTGVTSRSTVVVVHAPTGQVRAIANRPVAGVPAHSSSYAPGSVFKVVTATALLRRGTTPATRVGCPATTSSGGRSFRNDEAKDLGTVSFAQAFAQSCNTSFLELAEGLPAGALQQAAALYGFGEPALLPVSVDPSLVPETAVPAEQAAAAIGQGRVEASPLVVASMAAAVATGTWRQPLLLPGTQDVRRLPPGVAASLRQLMRSVVTTGTGRAAQGAGGPVSGKTGTAQYGDGAVAHAWFTGFRGDLAVCVFVETGTSGGATAAPVARRLLAAL